MDIQKADPKARYRAVYLRCGFAIVVLTRHQEILVEQFKEVVVLELARTPHLLTVVSVVITSPVLLLSTLMLRYSRRVVSTNRFPLADDRLIRDTRVHHGPAAQRRALLLKYLAIALSLCAITISVLVYALVQTLN